tara:strand:+ start:342 stop:941 length:600 start_codon:yes stop_codon:yes gene_type:complete
MSDEKLEAALKQFAEIVPEEQLKQMLDGVVPVKNEAAPGFIAPALTMLAANPKYAGLLVRKLAGFLHEVTGVDIDKIPFVDKATAKPSDFFFWYNRGLDKLRKKHPVMFKAFMAKTATFDAAGYLSVLAGQDQKVINIIIKSFELDLPLAGTDDETTYKDSLKQKQIGKAMDDRLQDKYKLEEQMQRLQVLAGINKKVL